MPVPYTHGVWHVKPGKAEDFVAAWQEFADWTIENVDGAGWGRRFARIRELLVSFEPSTLEPVVERG